MTKYVCLVKLRLDSFVAWKLEHIPRGSIEKVNALAVVVASLPNALPCLLPIEVVNCCQLSKRDRRSMSLLDDSNSSLSKLGRAP